MKTAIITLLIFGLFFNSCTKLEKYNYSQFNKAYTNFIELATTEFGAKYGMAIVVVKDDVIVFENYRGMANVEKHIKVSKNTLFYIASVTKSFTAMAALILESKGKLDFNKSLAEFFPEIDFAPELRANSITIEHLIIHTSGIRNRPIGYVNSYTGAYNSDTLLVLLEKYSEINTDASFENFEYTNLGYNILGMIMEKELGTDWKSLVEQEVLTPLKMDHTSTRMSTAINKGWEIAKPHSQNNDTNTLVRLSIEKNDNTMHAAGGIISTARDMSRWMMAELNNGKINGEQIIDSGLVKKSQLNHAKQNRTWYDLKRFGYGYGWNIATTPLGDTLVHHYGSFNGMHPQFSFVRKTKVGVVVMANEGSLSYPLNMLLSSYVHDYFSKRENIDVYYKEKLKKYKADYVKDIKSNNDYIDRIAKRSWLLEQPNSSYAGRYSNDLFGDIVVKLTKNNTFVTTIGNLKSNLVSAHRTNAFRVQMEENGGSVVQFEIVDGSVAKATWKGQTYIKDVKK